MTVYFPITNAPNLLTHYKTHYQFINKSLTLSDAAKPKKSKSTTRWANYNPTFLNYLRTIPRRDGVPLNYTCHVNEALYLTPNGYFLGDYVSMAEINGKGITVDTANMHTFILTLYQAIRQLRLKIHDYESHNNGRPNYIELKEHYKGVGLHAL